MNDRPEDFPSVAPDEPHTDFSKDVNELPPPATKKRDENEPHFYRPRS